MSKSIESELDLYNKTLSNIKNFFQLNYLPFIEDHTGYIWTEINGRIVYANEEITVNLMEASLEERRDYWVPESIRLKRKIEGFSYFYVYDNGTEGHLIFDNSKYHEPDERIEDYI